MNRRRWNFVTNSSTWLRQEHDNFLSKRKYIYIPYTDKASLEYPRALHFLKKSETVNLYLLISTAAAVKALDILVIFYSLTE